MWRLRTPFSSSTSANTRASDEVGAGPSAAEDPARLAAGGGRLDPVLGLARLAERDQRPHRHAHFGALRGANRRSGAIASAVTNPAQTLSDLAVPASLCLGARWLAVPVVGGRGVVYLHRPGDTTCRCRRVSDLVQASGRVAI